MTGMSEEVGLPDPSVKRYLHPTDLPEARDLYRRGWWFARLSSIPVNVAIASLVWMVGGSVAATILAPAVTCAVGLVAGRWFTARAWDYVPRRRRDEEGAPIMRLLATAIDAAALIVIAGALVLSLGSRPVPDPVVIVATGAGGAVAVIQLVELLVGLRARKGTLLTVRRLMLLIAVLSATAVLGAMGVRGGWGDGAALLVALGAAMVVLAYALWWAVDRWSVRRHVADER